MRTGGSILGLHDLTQEAETGLGQRGVKGELFEPWVPGREGGQRLWGLSLVLPRLPTVSSGKGQSGFPLMGPYEAKGA